MDDPNAIYYVWEKDDGGIGYGPDPRPYTDEVLSSPIEIIFPIFEGVVSSGYTPGTYMVVAALVSIGADFPADYLVSTCKDPSDVNSLILTLPLINFTGKTQE